MNIGELVARYKSERKTYIKSTYNETQLRNDFIDPLLKCFGWDVDNEYKKTQIFRDVIQEESIKVEEEGTKKNPDYTLRINGTRKIFVEVKKPSINILNSSKSAFQTRRYGWSANLGISILTNFETLIIYDCRYRPNISDDEHVARYRVFSFVDFEESFDEIYNLISFDAANSGVLDELFSIDVRKGETFDDFFLQQIESWRIRLAESTIRSNPIINEEDLNFTIQRLLNRIIFLRICEDRTIEKYETIKTIKNFDELKSLFSKSDKKFNSGLFNFIEDALSQEIDINSDVLISVFDELYYPQSPYDFSVVDSTILSQIYERFLGSRLVIDDKKNVCLIDSHEVSASSGVVSTPKLIVEQIVKETLASLVDSKSYEELTRITIADICCGSGTFLISAYDFMLERLTEKVIEEEIKDSRLMCDTNGNSKRLSLKAKRELLVNNLFGVDINPYAVEVTEFSLLLKLLENETEVSINNFILESSEGILPSLTSNIKCGNSLVDSKFFEFMPEALKNDRLLFNIRPFDWRDEFPRIMEKNGFDAIIGNPPYVRIQNMQKYSPEEIKYYQSDKSQYTVAKKATIDKYFIFIQRALELINPEGMVGYIVPHKFFVTMGGKELRKLIVKDYQIKRIIHFGVTQVFPERSTYTAILILQSNKNEYFEYKNVSRISAKSLSSDENIQELKTDSLDSNPWIFVSPETKQIFDRFVTDDFEQLKSFADITVGLQTSMDQIYIINPEFQDDDSYRFTYNEKTYSIEKSICKPVIYDLSFKAFDSIEGNAQIIFPYTIEENKATLISENILENNYPLAWKYLSENREALEKRKLQGKNPIWYQYGRSQSLTKFHNNEKLVWSVLAKQAPYAIDTNNLLFTGGGNGPYYGLLNKSEYSILYLLGILSHPVIESMVKSRASEFRGAYYSHSKQFIETIPIRKIEFSIMSDKENYNLVVRTVKNLIDTTAQLKNEKNNSRKVVLKRKIKQLNMQLVNVINKLYNINDNEFLTVIKDNSSIIDEEGE